MERPAVERRKLCGDEVLAMVTAGIIDAGEPVELLYGELVVVSPQGPDHASAAAILASVLRKEYGAGFSVRAHSPVVAGTHSLPEPDVAVVRGAPARYHDRHPGPADTVLVLEITSSTRATDRRKAAIYGAAGFPHYWRVDLPQRRLERFAAPGPDGAYRELTTTGWDEPAPLPTLDPAEPLTLADHVPGGRR